MKPQPELKKQAAKIKKAAPKADLSPDGFDYKIQLAAAPSQIDITKSRYAALADQIVVKKIDGLYKYLVPAGNNHQTASQTLNEVKKKGFPKVFISVYKGDERVRILYK